MSWTTWEKVSEFDFKELIYEKKHHTVIGGGVARVTMNRPERMNTLTDTMMKEMSVALDDASHDKSIGVVVYTGSGNNFCAGGDVEAEAAGMLRQAFYFSFPVDWNMRNCRKPIIAAVKGWCIGGGNHLAYFCDMTIADSTAMFGQNGPRVGSPADGFIVARAAQVLGTKKAREMWMLCRRYTAKEAVEMGLINRVVSAGKLDEEVDQWCEEILSASPGCIEILKATFDNALDWGQGGESRIMFPDWFEAGGEMTEAQQAFLEKRKPDYWKLRK